jgi:hypothetical protein
MSQTDWLPGAIALAVGLGVGVALALRAARAAARGAGQPQLAAASGLAVRDLRARRDALFVRLRELAEVAPREGPEPAARERYETELEAARVVRDLERASAERPMKVHKKLESVERIELEKAKSLPDAAEEPARRLRKKKLEAKKGRLTLELRSLLIGMWLGGTIVLIVFLLRDAMRPRGEAMTGGPGAAPMAAPAGGMQGQAEQVVASGEIDVAGTLELDPSVGAVPPGAVIFIYARQDGATRGPPIEARRVVADKLPVPFELTAADSMMGQPFPAKARIEARIDFDGDPMTHDPAEPRAVVEGIAKGASGVRLVLKRGAN